MAILEVEIFKVFALVFVRFSGLMVSAPVLGSANIPARVKVGVAAFCALLMTPMIAAVPGGLPSEPLGLAAFGVSELLVGLAVGFGMTIVFAAIQVGGQIMDLQTGFGLINVFNPALETQVPVFGFFFFILAVLYLLAINGHHMMIEAVAYSFERIPLGGLVLRPAIAERFALMGTAMFYDGLVIAAPVAAAMMLAYATMGFLGRVVPQIHLFVVGFPLTIAIGLSLVVVLLSVYLFVVVDGMFAQMFRDAEALIRLMG